MAPKGRPQKKAAPKVYDYSGLEKGMRLQVEADGTYYAAEVVQVSTAKNRSKAPVKVSYRGYDGYDEWVGGDRLRSKAIKEVKPEPKEKRAPFKLYGVPLSQPSRSMLLLCNEAGVDHEFVPLNLAEGEHKKEPYLSVNPMGQVPALADGDFVLAEGAAMLAYIASSRKLGSWYPSNPKIRGKIDYWMHWNHTNARKSTGEIIKPWLFENKNPDGEKIFGPVAAFMEASLSKSGPFLAGTKKPTIADLFILPEMDQLTAEATGLPQGLFNYDSYPKVKEWMAACKDALPKSYEKNFATAGDLLKSIKGK